MGATLARRFNVDRRRESRLRPMDCLAWDVADRQGRPEAWGTDPSHIRTQRSWVMWMRPPLFMLANLPSWPAATFITSHVNRSVKKLEFVATMRFGYGILLMPLTWLIWAGLAALVAPDGWGWLAAAAMWVVGARRFSVAHLGPNQTSRPADRRDGEVFWNREEICSCQGKAWQHYLLRLLQDGQCNC